MTKGSRDPGKSSARRSGGGCGVMTGYGHWPNTETSCHGKGAGRGAPELQ